MNDDVPFISCLENIPIIPLFLAGEGEREGHIAFTPLNPPPSKGEEIEPTTFMPRDWYRSEFRQIRST